MALSCAHPSTSCEKRSDACDANDWQLHLTQRNGAWLSAEDEIVELLRRDTGITGDIQQTMLQDTQPNATCTVED